MFRGYNASALNIRLSCQRLITFLSRVCSETTGGLPGLLLTLAGMGDEGMSVNVWGPSDLKYLVDAMRSFIPKAAMVHTHSFGPIPGSEGVAIPDPRTFNDPLVLLDDEVVKITAILLRPSCSEVSSLKTEVTTRINNASEFGLEEGRDQFKPHLLPHSSDNKAKLAPMKHRYFTRGRRGGVGLGHAGDTAGHVSDTNKKSVVKLKKKWTREGHDKDTFQTREGYVSNTGVAFLQFLKQLRG